MSVDWPNLPPSEEARILGIIAQGALLVQAARHAAIALLMLAVYDWLLSLGDEIDLIHKARWTMIKVAYLFCRYYPLLVGPIFVAMWVGDHTFEVCRSFVHPFYVLFVPCQLAAQAVMIIRTHGFTGHNKLYLVILIVSLILVTGAQIWLFGFRFEVTRDLFTALGPINGCFGTDRSLADNGMGQGANSNPGLVMLGSVIIDFLIIIFVLLHSVRIKSCQGRLGRSFLLQALIFFIVMAATNLLTALTYLGDNKIYHGLGLPFTFLLPPIIACRIVLSLRRHVSPTEAQELSEQSRVVREGFELLVVRDKSLLLPYTNRHPPNKTWGNGSSGSGTR